MASKIRNADQTCVCADRFLVHETVHDAFVEKLAASARNSKVGAGMDPSTTMGPMIASDAVTKTHQKVKDAIQEGAKCGGSILEDLGTHFYEPTILTDASPMEDGNLWSSGTSDTLCFGGGSLATCQLLGCGLGVLFLYKRPEPSISICRVTGMWDCGLNDGIIPLEA